MTHTDTIKLLYSATTSCLSWSLQKDNRTNLEVRRSSNLGRNTLRLNALVLHLSKEQLTLIQAFIQPNGNSSKDVIISTRSWFTGPTAQKQRSLGLFHPNPLKTPSFSY